MSLWRAGFECLSFKVSTHAIFAFIGNIADLDDYVASLPLSAATISVLLQRVSGVFHRHSLIHNIANIFFR
jgi:hypothetical protein